jgi:hypothetical protein
VGLDTGGTGESGNAVEMVERMEGSVIYPLHWSLGIIIGRSESTSIKTWFIAAPRTYLANLQFNQHL